MLILTGKRKGNIGHSWNRFRIEGTVSERVQVTLKFPSPGHCCHLFPYTFNKQRLPGRYCVSYRAYSSE